MDAPLWGDTGGHTGTAPTNLNQPHVVCHYPIGVIHLHIGGGNASRTPTPILKIKKCVYRYDFGATVDDAICLKINYSLGVTVDDVICFKTSYSFGVTVASP